MGVLPVRAPDPASASGKSLRFVFFDHLWPEAQIVNRHSEYSANNRQISQPLQRLLPELHGPRNMRIRRKSAVQLGIFRVMQHVNHVRAAYARRIIYARILESGHIPQLLRSLLCEEFHVFLRAEMQAARRTRFDAGRLESRAHAVYAKRALENFSRSGAELRNVERTSRHAVAAADAMLLLKINNPVHILNDRSIRRARRQASRILAVHALIFAHQQHHAVRRDARVR